MVWGERAEYGDGECHHLWGGVNVQDTTYNLALMITGEHYECLGPRKCYGNHTQHPADTAAGGHYPPAAQSGV
jgi:hypothetical protein